MNATPAKEKAIPTVVCAGPARWLCTIGYGHICVIAAELDAAE